MLFAIIFLLVFAALGALALYLLHNFEHGEVQF
jgi:hypothetical protein